MSDEAVSDEAVSDAPESLLGETLELDIDGPAQDSCVARHAGRVVFVRHALPGERVRATVTEDRGRSFLRADAVEIVRAAPARVTPPCPHAGPGRCGGCDWQHANPAAQRVLKEQVIRDQFARLGGIELGDLLREVEQLPGGPVGWRTRIAYAVDADGRPGLRRHASHEVEHVERCPLGVPGVGDADALATTWPGASGVEVVRGDDGELAVLTHRPAPRARRGRGRRAPDVVTLQSGPQRLRRDVAGHALRVSAGGFWQVHPAAADVYASAVVEALGGAAALHGTRILDLYAGAGALTVALAAAAGPGGQVRGLDADARAVADAEANLADVPHAEVRAGRVTPDAVAALAEQSAVDFVVLDPPRAGAGADVIRAIVELRPRGVAYLSCDAATLARDVAAAAAQGWRLRSLRAFDAFPMTAHVECLAMLAP